MESARIPVGYAWASLFFTSTHRPQRPSLHLRVQQVQRVHPFLRAVAPDLDRCDLVAVGELRAPWPVDEVELRALAAAAQYVDLVAEHSVLVGSQAFPKRRRWVRS